MSIEEAIASRQLERWIVSQAKATWRKGKCLWDWAEEQRKKDAAKVAAKAERKAQREAKKGGGKKPAEVSTP